MDQGRGQEKLQGPPLLSRLALGTCSAVPPSLGCPSLTSESIAGGQGGRGGKLASCLYSEGVTVKEAGTDRQVLGDSLPLWGMLIHAFLSS